MKDIYELEADEYFIIILLTALATCLLTCAILHFIYMPYINNNNLYKAICLLTNEKRAGHELIYTNEFKNAGDDDVIGCYYRNKKTNVMYPINEVEK